MTTTTTTTRTIDYSCQLDIPTRKWEHPNKIDRHRNVSIRYCAKQMGFLPVLHAWMKRSHERMLMQQRKEEVVLLVVGLQRAVAASVGGLPLLVDGLDCSTWLCYCVAFAP